MIGKIITALVGVVCIVVAVSVINGMEAQMASDNVTMPSAAKAMVNVMPYMLSAVVVLGIFAGGTAVHHYVVVRRWRDFGNRMKEAYTAKFGYPNPGFEEEVDQHIKAMEALGTGDTRNTNEDWLKRMAKFVEIPYIVPEEELLSEVEKTKQYSKEDK